MASTHQEARINLARAAATFGGPDWASFVEAMRVYDREMQKLLVLSQADQLQKFQGHAQASAQLLEIFENCRQIAETARQKEVKKP